VSAGARQVGLPNSGHARPSHRGRSETDACGWTADRHGLAKSGRDDERGGLKKVIWHGQVIAESNQTIELDGYHYFRPASVRMEFLQSAPKTEADLSLSP